MKMKATLRSLDLAYMAGILDGEGCILIAKKKPLKGKSPSYYIRVKVDMCNSYIPALFKFNFGGGIAKVRRIKPQYQPISGWYIANRQAMECLKTLLPFLRLKRNEAELAISFQSKIAMRNPHRGLTDAQLALREADRILMKALKVKS